MYDDDDDAYDVNRTPTAFAWRNYQQPESCKSSLQKQRAHHGHTGKAMIRPGFDKSGKHNTFQRPNMWLERILNSDLHHCFEPQINHGNAN